jgi:hypothetical protein
VIFVGVRKRVALILPSNQVRSGHNRQSRSIRLVKHERTPKATRTRGVTFAAYIIRPLNADWSRRARTGSQLELVLHMSRTANWSCSELQCVAGELTTVTCRRIEMNCTRQFNSVQFVDMHRAYDAHCVPCATN